MSSQFIKNLSLNLFSRKVQEVRSNNYNRSKMNLKKLVSWAISVSRNQQNYRTPWIPLAARALFISSKKRPTLKMMTTCSSWHPFKTHWRLLKKWIIKARTTRRQYHRSKTTQGSEPNHAIKRWITVKMRRTKRIPVGKKLECQKGGSQQATIH
jgi:hypothetical protein